MTGSVLSPLTGTAGTEVKTGGNGITGHNETSENLDGTWVVRDPTPKAATVGAMP